MNSSRTGRFALVAAFFMVGLSLASCKNDPEELVPEQPEPVILPLEGSSPSAVARLGDDYYLAAGNVYKRGFASAADSWTEVDKPAGALLCTSLAASAGRIYAAFVDSDANNLGLYWSDGSGSPLVWTEVSPVILHAVSVKITAVMRANSNIFVSTENTVSGGARYFRLYLINDAGPTASGSNVDIPFDEDDPWRFKPIVSMTHDGSAYWFISGAYLFSGTAQTYTMVAETGMPDNSSLKAIRWFASSNRLIVTTGSGMFRTNPAASLAGSTPGTVYARSAANDWEQSAPISLASGIEPGYANFTDCIAVPGAASEILLLIGSSSSIQYDDGIAQNTKAAAARGYGTFRPSGAGSISAIASSDTSTAPIASVANFGATLSEDIVTAFSEDDGFPGGARTLFALTAGDGLYSNRYDGTNWEGWVHEHE